MHIAYLHFHTVWIISSRYLQWSRHFSEQPSSAELIRWEIMNMTWCLIITNHDPDHHLTCPGCLVITDVCWDHNPELSHHDRARQAQPFSGAAYNGKWLRFSFSQCFLNQSRCHTREKVGGRTWGKLDLMSDWPMCLLAILWLVDTDHVTWILAWDWSELTRTVTDCFLQFLSLILSSHCVSSHRYYLLIYVLHPTGSFQHGFQIPD